MHQQTFQPLPDWESPRYNELPRFIHTRYVYNTPAAACSQNRQEFIAVLLYWAPLLRKLQHGKWVLGLFLHALAILMETIATFRFCANSRWKHLLFHKDLATLPTVQNNGLLPIENFSNQFWQFRHRQFLEDISSRHLQYSRSTRGASASQRQNVGR
ncbi:hypothetical protein DFH07DRAFT_782534 [Mycena maculata]|uniref:Uncharacterized protein n=1 Tax=Mycena maculata TaxID=230809 RepID=A0AAD7HSF7_9AGAR|nr:hypothetical protein DFH07DRAFT_782534 [Mycena maculata]